MSTATGAPSAPSAAAAAKGPKGGAAGTKGNGLGAADGMLPKDSPIRPPFSVLVSQPYAARFLSAAIASGQTNHAYLFMGPLGAGKTEAAMLLAEELLCRPGNAAGSAAGNAVGSDKGSAAGSGDAAGNATGSDADNADDRIRVRHGTHPDLNVVNPLGAAGYLAEQIAEIIHDAALAPMRSTHKVYLITRADLLRGTSANALLKTLEEPPASVTFILLARTREAVLPTILSRCQVIAFRRVPEAEAAATVCARTGADEANVRIALAVTGGSVARAEGFLRSAERRAARLEVLGILELLERSDDLEVLDGVKRLLVALKAPLDSVRVAQELEREQGKDCLTKGALSRLEQQHRRELTSRERETIGDALNIIRTWLRDVLMVRVGAQGPLNYDHHHHISRTANSVPEERILAALAAVDCAQEQIQYNVAVQLALETMFLRIRRELR